MRRHLSLAWTAASLVCAGYLIIGGAQFAAAQNSGPVLEERHPRYVLEREDVLLVSFPLSTELNQTVTIQPDDGARSRAASLTWQANVDAVYGAGLLTHAS